MIIVDIIVMLIGIVIGLIVLVILIAFLIELMKAFATSDKKKGERDDGTNRNDGD